MTAIITSGSVSTKSLLDRAQAAIEKNLKNVSLNKATLTTSDLSSGGGLRAVQQSKKFIKLLRHGPDLLRACRIVPMRGPTDRVDRITFSGRILHAASEDTELSSSNEANPTTSKVELTAKLYKGCVPISYEALQDNIEGGQDVRGNSFEEMVMTLIAEGVAIDAEELGLNSDTTSGTTDYAQQNGWMKLAQNSHSYDHSGAALSKSFFKSTLLAIPAAYRQSRFRKDMIWAMNPDMAVEWRDELADNSYADRATRVVWGSGDKDVDVAYSVPILESANLPAESGTSSNLGKVLLTHRKNIVLGVWRNIFFDIGRDVKAGSLIVVPSVRFAFQFEQVEGAALGYNVKVQ